MKITSIQYFFKEAFKSLIKNSLMTFASIFTVSSCIFILIVSFNFASNIDFTLASVQNSMGITVYLNDNISSDTVKMLYDKVLQVDGVSSVKYISSEDAFNNFKGTLQNKSKILEGLPVDTLLPRSFEIYLKDNNKREEVINVINGDVGEDKYYSSVRQLQLETNVMTSISNVIRVVGIILIIGLGLISTIIIINTIKIAVNNRKTEINIMKYVGATDWFIRWPFFIEGVLIGLIGALIPIVLTYSTYNKSINFIIANLGFAGRILKFKSATQLFSISIPLAILIGISIGVIGSVTSIHKHLRV